jgi:nitrite reductase/ring-hydroxylating ferredoxin subunit
MSEHRAFDDALERIIADRSPREELSMLDADEQRMIEFAQLLHGSAGGLPHSEFREELHQRITPAPRRISRRTAFFSGLGAMAAGLLGGIGLDHMVSGLSKGGSRQAAGPRWTQVARVEDVPTGAVRTFTVGDVPGFLVNTQGQVKAMSRICTHMGCALRYQAKDAELVCPCHGAKFDLLGSYVPSQQSAYSTGLPPLPKLNVRVRDGAIEVWSA